MDPGPLPVLRSSSQPSVEDYGDVSNRIWNLYLKEAAEADREITENWKGDADGILIFVRALPLHSLLHSRRVQTGLFAATVATFFVDSYKTMQLDTGAATVLLLAQLSQQISALSNGSGNSSSPPPLSFDPTALNPLPSPANVRINVLWAMSLVLSLICALMATFVQQWARRYLGRTKRRLAPRKHARLRAHLYHGVETFGVASAVNAIPALLHISVFLFLAGFIEYQLSINVVVAYSVLVLATAAGVVYVVLSILPVVVPNCPYQTPLSSLLRPILSLLFLLLATGPSLLHTGLLRLYNRYPRFRSERILSWCRPLWILLNRRRRQAKTVRNQEAQDNALAVADSFALDVDAVVWTMDSLDDDSDFERFVESIPGFYSHESEGGTKILDAVHARGDTWNSLPNRIVSLAGTCQDASGEFTLHPQRLLSCSRALLCVPHSYTFDKDTWACTVAQSNLADVSKALSPLQDSDPDHLIIAIRARYSIALAVLNTLKAPDSTDKLPLLISCIALPPPFIERIERIAKDDPRILAVANFISYVSGTLIWLRRLRRNHAGGSPSSWAWELWRKLPGDWPKRVDLSDEARAVALDVLDNALQTLDPRFGGPEVLPDHKTLQDEGAWYNLLVSLRAAHLVLSRRVSIDGTVSERGALLDRCLFSQEEERFINRDWQPQAGIFD